MAEQKALKKVGLAGTETPIGPPSGDEAELEQWNKEHEAPRGKEVHDMHEEEHSVNLQSTSALEHNVEDIAEDDMSGEIGLVKDRTNDDNSGGETADTEMTNLEEIIDSDKSLTEGKGEKTVNEHTAQSKETVSAEELGEKTTDENMEMKT